MNTKFTYALVLSIALAVFNLILFLAGFQTEKVAAGQHVGWLTIIIHIVVLWLGIKAVREETPTKTFSYGQGVGTGVLISLYSGLMSGAYNFVHFKFINPDFAEHQMAAVREKWAAAGMSAASMDRAEPIARKMMSPVAVGIFTPISMIATGALVALILAAILKRSAPVSLSSEPPQ